jgi:DNA-directed RNA polymerase specialized sigma24 family protein
MGAIVIEHSGDEVGTPDFEAWVDARGPALLRFAYLVTGNADAAQDAAHDALTSACAKWGRIRRTADPDAYVRRMVANAHISWWRRVARRESPSADVVPPGTVAASALAETDAAWQLCSTLPQRQRAAVVLHLRYQGCDHNGFDDGTGVYALTADAIRPLLRDSNAITTGPSAAADVVWGD